MNHGLPVPLTCIGIQKEIVPFLNLYELWELAAASRASNRWTQSSPWYEVLFWSSPRDYVAMRMHLPHRTFRSLRKLRLDWTYGGSFEDPEPEEGIFKAFVEHMENAKKLLPRLACVEVGVNLSGRFEIDDYYPHSVTCRVDVLVDFLENISYVEELALDLRGTTNLQPQELEAILSGCLSRSLHKSFKIALRSTTPSFQGRWSEGQDADVWSEVVANGLSMDATQALRFLLLRIETRSVARPIILGARRTCLKVSPATASVLGGRMVKYRSGGIAGLRDADGVILPSGPFFARLVNRNYLELFDSEGHARRAGRLRASGHAGRQKFTRERMSFGSDCTFELPEGRGIHALATAFASLPDLSVALEGSGFLESSFGALSNVQVDTTEPPPSSDGSSSDGSSSS